MTDVWQLPAIGRWEKSCGKHPTQKPLGVLARLIQASTKPEYHGDGEFDTFLSLLIMLKPAAESLDSCMIPAPFFFFFMRILSLSRIVGSVLTFHFLP